MRKASDGVELTASLPGGHLGRVIDVSWSPDGSRVASSSFDGTIRLWSPSVSASPISPPLDPDGGDCVLRGLGTDASLPRFGTRGRLDPHLGSGLTRISTHASRL